MKIIIANWKMNGNLSLVDKFKRELNDINTENKIILCPPTALVGNFGNFKHFTGAQDCFSREAGAFTGETSPKLLKELGCDYVILGHSERRTIFQESNDIIYEKWEASIGQSLNPIVCIGETSSERANWKEVLATQMTPYLTGSTAVDSLAGTIFAYEPVWSIGTGLTPSPEDLEPIFDFIKNSLPTKNSCALVYGGSVRSANAHCLAHCKNVDGLLVGGASLDIDEFKAILGAV
jgi:triosephosphate isomerase